MLSYKLCKLLKEAWFPQEVSEGGYFYLNPKEKINLVAEYLLGYPKIIRVGTKGKTVLLKRYGREKIDEETICKIPTLESLIDACGDDFQKLETIIGNKWQGVGGKGIREIEMEGKTPKIAVAKLWLKLNKK